MTDRRSGIERRHAERFAVTVDLEWENHAGKHPGTLSDISERGCFVLSAGVYADGERVSIHLPFAGHEPVKVAGEITNHVFELGFAAAFIDMSDDLAEVIRAFSAANNSSE
ncbi:hypothetical protein BH24ACI3_BH24ACI3_01970 [soil metagenome]